MLFTFIYGGVLIALSPALTWIVIVALPLQATVYLFMGPPLRRRLRDQFDAGARHQARIVDSITGISSIKALGAEEPLTQGLDITLTNTLSASLRVALLNITSGQLSFVIGRALTITIIFVGAQLVFAGQLTLGQLIAFHLIAEKVAGPISNFSRLWESWQNVRIARQRTGDILNVEPEPFAKKPPLPANLNADLRFSNVAFAYGENDPVLSEFTFEADQDTLTLVVGPSGAGKSTFGRLAAGIEYPQTGTVTLGGFDLAAHDPHDVRSKIAYVPQESYLFSGSILDNLRLPHKDATKDDIARALYLSVADAFVQSLPQGLETQVGERGQWLSGGQRQRIAMARALVGKPQVLILDEPTSALDEETQSHLSERIRSLKANTTIIVVTHNPAAFCAVDRIVRLGPT